jgi:hypothetical protein
MRATRRKESSEDFSAITHIMRAMWRSLSLIRFIRPPVAPTAGRWTYIDDVDQVFQVARPVYEPVEVVEEHPVDHPGREVCKEPAELGADDHPVDGSIGADDLALLEGRGVVLPVDAREGTPSQVTAGVLGVLVPAVHARFQAEAVGGNAQVRAWALGR